VKKSSIEISIKEECAGNNCIPKENEHPKWSAWLPWGDCSVPCGGGVHNRTRYCEGIGCAGPSTQTKECNRHECQPEWGCWSEWSPCNTSCGWGVRTRHRVCLGYNCTGSDRDREACQNSPCHCKYKSLSFIFTKCIEFSHSWMEQLDSVVVVRQE
jgi:semaphorin 5